MKNILILLSVALLLSGCVKEKKEDSLKISPKIVKMLDVKLGKSNTTYEYPAQIFAAKDTTMAFEVSGKIVEFNYQEGQKVPKGAVIASLDDTILQANHDLARANYNKAMMDFKRYEALYKSRSIAKEALERTKQNLEVTKAGYEVAKKNLRETKLIAEFDGVLAKKIVNDYARVTAKQPIVLLQDTSFYKVKFYAPEHDVMKVRGGFDPKNVEKLADFFVTVGDGVKKIYKAKFLDISTTAQTVTRTFEATLRMEREKGSILLPGMSAKVSVVPKINQETKYFIPSQAIFSDKNSNANVWRINEDMRVHKQPVQVGVIQEDKIQVIKGLEGVKKIVLSGVRFLKENDKVQAYKKMGE